MKSKDNNSKFKIQNSRLSNNVYVVIMAGGKGERFWPLSTDSAPKPFLKIVGEKTLIQLTVERAIKLVPVDRVFIILGRQHLGIAKKQLEILPNENFIIEPEGRDTAPCIGYSALRVSEKNEEAVMVVLPADQFIPDVDNFVKTISSALKFAEQHDCLVTVGIKPVRSETGYGYINVFEALDNTDGELCYKVNSYVEKPDKKMAEKYLKEGNYYWNGGMFIWRAKTVMAGIKKHMPDLHDGLMKLKDAIISGNAEKIAGVYVGLQRKSIDYGLMEKADNVLMIPAQFIWDDIGTWSSITRVSELDNSGNYIRGNVVNIDSKDCVILGDNFTVGVVGVSNLVIVASKKGILICNADRAQEVREIAKRLHEK